jgi:nicotinamide mononucleotide transporter
MTILAWLAKHYIEIFGALTGLLYIYFSIKENILLWPTGIISSAVYIYVFFNSKFYADMSLQVYYLIISIYGWILWAKGSQKDTDDNLPITKTPKKIYFTLFLITLALFIVIGIILDKATDSPLPYWDSFTTSLSITATWMLAKKYIEQWHIWIIVDSVSAALYIYKGLYPTVILFIVFTTMAVVGYLQWKKSLINA